MPLNRTMLAALALSLSLTSCIKDKDNQAPIVDAGESLSTKTTSVEVSGNATDNDGKIVTYFWSQVSGPAASTIINPSGTATKIEFTKSGNYVFQLAATDDKGTVGVDTLTVEVEILNTKVMTADATSSLSLAVLNGSDYSVPATTQFTSIGGVCWSSGGDNYTQRQLLRFLDVSAIPVDATIKSAHLYLYSDPQPSLGNKADANFGSANALLIQRVSDRWPVYSGWFNQPLTTTDDLITIPATNQPYLDLNVDVTTIVTKMVTLKGAEWGFLIRLQNETPNNSRIFVSPRNNTAYPQKYPRLEVVYNYQ